jgi:serine O-acetyltransferase
MSLTAASSPSPVHPDWATLYTEAQALIAAEVTLAGLVQSYFPADGTFAAALGRRLADSLQAPAVGKDVLETLFAEILTDGDALTTSGLADLYAIRSRDPSCPSYLHAFLNLKGFQALQAYRVSHQLWTSGRVEMASWLSNRVSLVIGADIHPAAKIGDGVMFDHGSGVVIGETAVVENNVSILQNVTLGGTGKVGGDRHPKVRFGVMIGAGAKIIGNIEIGANSKVAAGSVVLKNVPPNCTVAGIPAQIVRIHDAAIAPSETMDQSL